MSSLDQVGFQRRWGRLEGCAFQGTGLNFACQNPAQSDIGHVVELAGHTHHFCNGDGVRSGEGDSVSMVLSDRGDKSILCVGHNDLNPKLRDLSLLYQDILQLQEF